MYEPKGRYRPFMTAAMLTCGKTQAQIAKEVGFENANNISYQIWPCSSFVRQGHPIRESCWCAARRFYDDVLIREIPRNL